MMSIPTYTLVAALGQHHELGDGKDLLWRLPEDLKFFKKATLGGLVIMGRKTYESLPPNFRPLPGRENIVLTRQESWSMEGVTALHIRGTRFMIMSEAKKNLPLSLGVVSYTIMVFLLHKPCC